MEIVPEAPVPCPRIPRRITTKTAPTGKRLVPNVEDLLPAGREVAEALAAEGRPLTRDNLPELAEARRDAPPTRRWADK